MPRSNKSTSVLVTGAAGFIGFHLAHRLLADGHKVIGLDNLNDYYDVKLKASRLDLLKKYRTFSFKRLDLCDGGKLRNVLRTHSPLHVVNLAAQVGVRYSLTNPMLYARSNLIGFLNLLEACRDTGIGHLVYASSSSVYGANSKLPFVETDNTDRPVSLYGATKKANELMAHAYSGLFGFPATGLRFFTVYGPWYRPDMAMFKFTKAILAGKPIELYNNGQMMRDFTYVDDIVEGIVRIMGHHSGTPNRSGENPAGSRHHLYNIGNHTPVSLLEVVRLLENILETKAVVKLLPMQDGDVPDTFADIKGLQRAVGFAPRTTLEVGVPRFVKWYREYYGL